MKKIKIIKGYKALNKDLTATMGNKPFQYKIGKEYKEDKAILCSSGFHFCENPLDTLNYYDLCESRFFEIEAKEVSDERNNEDSKRVAKRIKLKTELNLEDLIKLSFEYIKDQCKVDEDKSKIKSDENSSKVATSGDYSKVATSGDSSQVATSGDSSQVATSGDYSKVATSGYYSQVATSGDYSQVATSGYSSKVATSGYSSQVATSGDYSQVATSGYYSQVATSGYSSKVATSGNSSQVATSGDSSQVATSGDYSQVATSGYSSQVALNGEYSVGMCAGINSKIKGKKGNWITLSEWEYDDYICKYKPICVKSAQIDGKILKEDTYYMLKDGEFEEC